MIDTDRYEGHTEGPWKVRTYYDMTWVCYSKDDDSECSFVKMWEEHENEQDAQLIADAPLLLAEVKRLQSEPTVTVDDYHKKGHLFITVRFPDGDEYVGLVEKQLGSRGVN